MARKFLYICAGMFLLALSYHLGADTATAQSRKIPIGLIYGPEGIVVMDQNGDLFWHKMVDVTEPSKGFVPGQAAHLGNFWTSATSTPATNR